MISPALIGRDVDERPDNAVLVTLLDLLRFYADRFSNLTCLLFDIRVGLNLEGAMPRWMDPPEWMIRMTGRDPAKFFVQSDDVRARLRSMKEVLRGCETPVSVSHIEDLIAKSESSKLDHRDIEGLQANIERELKSKVFFSIPASRRRFFDEPLKGWESMLAAFPETQDDIEEMNKCFALSRYTASVFHSLLVVEYGVIRLGKKIGVQDPKPGWDATYKRVMFLVNNRASASGDIDFDTIEQVKARLDSMKLAWRNKVNHAAGKLVIESAGFNDNAAEEIIIACRSFMRILAERLT